MSTVNDPSKGQGPFVRRKEIAGLVAAALQGRTQNGKGVPKDEGFVRNETEEEHDEFSVFEIGDPLISPDDDEDGFSFGETLFEAIEVSSDGVERICVIQTPASDDDTLVRAVFAGVTRVRLTGPSGQTHARPVAEEYTLEAASSGPCVILHDPGPEEEERVAIVRIGGGGSSGGGGSISINGCQCGDCLDAGSIDSSECSALGSLEAPNNMKWPAPPGAEDEFGPTISLIHDAGCVWLSDVFTVEGEDYIFKLTINGRSPEETILTLEDA